MRITIIAVGKIKEKYFTQAIEEYTKRLSRYCKLDIIQLQDEKTPDDASPRQEQQIKEHEGERILHAILEDAYVIALAINGKVYDSPGLAQHLQQLMTGGKSHIAFIIGGSLGLSEQVLKHANEKLSFSAMTFPHQLMRVILLEQIYRSFRIINHEPYHK